MNKTTDAIASACTAQASVATPIGALLLVRTGRGLAGAWFAAQKHHPPAFDVPVRPDDPLLARAAAALAGWFDAPHEGFDVPLDLHGTPFQQAVWAALLEIPFGRTLSYAEVAARVGAPSAVRAVGAAIGRNPVSIIVPCHRVIGRSGAMTGYAGGIDRKQALLRREGERVAADLAAMPAASLLD